MEICRQSAAKLVQAPKKLLRKPFFDHSKSPSTHKMRVNFFAHLQMAQVDAAQGFYFGARQ